MANNKQPQTLQSDDTEGLEAAAAAAEAELPPPGYEREEVLKQREDNLQAEIDRVTKDMLRGTVDASKLKIVDEIAAQTQHLSVSNQKPGFVYGWISKNRHGQHG